MRKEFLNGIRDTLPLIMAAIPFGVIYGAMAQSEGLSVWAAQGMSLFVFAGASQFIATLLWENTPGVMLILTILIVNLRHFLYSASLMKYASELPVAKKILMGFLMTDETYAAVSGRASKPMTSTEFFYRSGDSSSDRVGFRCGDGRCLYRYCRTAVKALSAMGMCSCRDRLFYHHLSLATPNRFIILFSRRDHGRCVGRDVNRYSS